MPVLSLLYIIYFCFCIFLSSSDIVTTVMLVTHPPPPPPTTHNSIVSQHVSQSAPFVTESQLHLRWRARWHMGCHKHITHILLWHHRYGMKYILNYKTSRICRSYMYGVRRIWLVWCGLVCVSRCGVVYSMWCSYSSFPIIVSISLYIIFVTCFLFRQKQVMQQLYNPPANRYFLDQIKVCYILIRVIGSIWVVLSSFSNSISKLKSC